MNACSALLWKTLKTIAAHIILGLAFALQVAHAQPGPKKSPAPAVTCATCHGGVAASYQMAGMRHALESPGENPVLRDHPDLKTQLNGYSYSVQTSGAASTYTVSDGEGSLKLPVRWMFGQNTQTWVLEKDGRLYESLVSYFPRENGLATTPGDERITPHTLTEAMGRELSPREVRACFNCHATHAVDGEHLTLDKLKPGLECARCHTDAEQHMADAVHDNFKSLPTSLNCMSSEDISSFCGQCHRTWDTVLRNHWRGPVNVRFQPYRLANSRCFSGTDPRVSCVACHDPHQQVKHDAVFYDPKCLACHGDPKSGSSKPMFKKCAVAASNCVSCHMPRVELPGGHAQFTDHQIRIVRSGEPYPH